MIREPFAQLGPKGTAKAFKMLGAVVFKKGVGYVSANGSNVKNYGGEHILGYTNPGEG